MRSKFSLLALTQSVCVKCQVAKCYGNHHAGGCKPIQKLFVVSNQFRIEYGLSLSLSLYQKNISKCCELLNLCHINRSGPVFQTQHMLHERIAHCVNGDRPSQCKMAKFDFPYRIKISELSATKFGKNSLCPQEDSLNQI